MDNYLGDLADIVRASGGGGIDHNQASTTTLSVSTSTSTSTSTYTTSDHNHMSIGWDNNNNNINQQNSYEFQDLYTFPDPLLPDMDAISSPGPLSGTGGVVFSGNTSGGPAALTNYHLCHSYSTSTKKMGQISVDDTTSTHGNSNSNSNSNGNNSGRVKPPMLAVSPNKRSFGFMSTSEMMSVNNASSPKDGFIGGRTGIQIPSPRNSGIKRRKSQAKKVVCIPATAAANSRQTGEVVPSDLWAWRKYGQKPIKGSPFPRGYYRCSSSKGCSARKQVERSRTDPNMLVITYTSEHNHPWPTQRNALAGSSRSHPSKGTNDAPVSSSSQNDEVLVKDEINDKEVHADIDARNGSMSLANYNTTVNNSTTTTTSMKDEEVTIDKHFGNKLEDNNNEDYYDDDQLPVINDNYRPMIMPQINCQQQCDQDFFKDLVEFEGDDPLNLLFTQEAKGSDPFSGFFDWTTQNFATTNGDEDRDEINKASTSG
ncbi:hypothetical protein RND81_08G008000 [Saponaria officinalis]|uniref:WRKY domain-containing protein n=1 Tax=Saponaria officinalis TaxID=3572 RepID=A0AAW1J1J2_SAPOF